MANNNSWSTVPGQRQALTVTPDTIRTVPNQVSRTESNRVNNRHQILEDNDELSASESESEFESAGFYLV